MTHSCDDNTLVMFYCLNCFLVSHDQHCWMENGFTDKKLKWARGCVFGLLCIKPALAQCVRRLLEAFEVTEDLCFCLILAKCVKASGSEWDRQTNTHIFGVPCSSSGWTLMKYDEIFAYLCSGNSKLICCQSMRSFWITVISIISKYIFWTRELNCILESNPVQRALSGLTSFRVCFFFAWCVQVFVIICQPWVSAIPTHYYVLTQVCAALLFMPWWMNKHEARRDSPTRACPLSFLSFDKYEQ